MTGQRFIVLAAAVAAAAAPLSVGTASAATNVASAAPAAHCNPWAFGLNACSCPAGWQVHYPPLWEPWGAVTCRRS